MRSSVPLVPSASRNTFSRNSSPTAKLSIDAPSVCASAVVVVIPLVPFAVPAPVTAVAKLSVSWSVLHRSNAVDQRHEATSVDTERL